MLDIEQLKLTHPLWKDIAKQCDYYYRSFQGGYAYKNGDFLTRYLDENHGPGDQYMKRIMATPLDNHVQTTVDIYRSFLFRELPNRELGFLLDNPLVEQWLDDTDQEGQSLNSFLKTANDLAMVMGSVWILVDKPSYKVETAAQEQELGLRAYACVYTPQNVLDWHHERDITGKVKLRYIKVIESENTETVTVTCWYEDKVCKYLVSKEERGDWGDILEYTEYENPLGYIPFVHHAPIRTPNRGVGHSLVADVADQQRYIYNLLSELEQNIRISGHPTLVKTPSTDASAGAGAIITVQEDMDPALKPYLLTPSNSGISGIISAIDNCVSAIQRMTHTSAIQVQKGQPISGVALQTERQLLNAKLSDIADTLKETELKMWDIWFDWQGMEMPDDFQVVYPETFDLRDKNVELEYMLKARSSGVTNPLFQAEVDRQIVMITIDDDYAQNMILTDMSEGFQAHAMVNPTTGQTYIANSQADHERLTAEGYVHLGE